MPKDEVPLDAASIALVRLWIDQGARATPASAPAPAPWEAPLALDRPAASADALALVDVHDRSLRRRLSWRAAGDGTGGGLRCAVRPPRLSRRLGSAAEAGRVDGVPGRPRARASATRSSRGCSPTTRNTPSTGSRSGTTCCATKTASHTSPRRRAVRASPTGCYRARVEPPLRPVRHAAHQPHRAGRSRRVRRRRQLARRDERRGHAVDAGVTEHRADLSGRQPEVQRVPRQLRQQVEAQGRVLARRRTSLPRPGCGCTAATSRRTRTPSPDSCIPS